MNPRTERGKRKMDKKRGAKHFLPTLKRVLSFLISFYPLLLPLTIYCIH